MTQKDHIDQLAKELRATIVYDQESPGNASAYSDSRELHLAPWSGNAAKDSLAYWVALHELGHIALHHSNDFAAVVFGPTRKTTSQEADAWLWGFSKAKWPLSQEGRIALAFSMTSYVHGGGVSPDDRAKVARLFEKVGEKPNWHSAALLGRDDEVQEQLSYLKSNWSNEFYTPAVEFLGGKE